MLSHSQPVSKIDKIYFGICFTLATQYAPFEKPLEITRETPHNPSKHVLDQHNKRRTIAQQQHQPVLAFVSQ